jgi:hypothetical protein
MEARAVTIWVPAGEQAIEGLRGVMGKGLGKAYGQEMEEEKEEFGTLSFGGGQAGWREGAADDAPSDVWAWVGKALNTVRWMIHAQKGSQFV